MKTKLHYPDNFLKLLPIYVVQVLAQKDYCSASASKPPNVLHNKQITNFSVLICGRNAAGINGLITTSKNLALIIQRKPVNARS